VVFVENGRRAARAEGVAAAAGAARAAFGRRTDMRPGVPRAERA
jgi:hypothetical protein